MGLLSRLALVWVLGGAIMMLTGCFGVAGYETYGGIRRVDTRKVIETTVEGESFFGSLTNWMFTDSTKQKEA